MDKYDLVYKELRQFKKTITINDYFQEGDMVALLKKYPKMLCYLHSFSYSSGPTSYLEIEYWNTSIPFETIFFVNDEKEMSRILYLFLKRYEEKVTFIVKDKKYFEACVSLIEAGRFDDFPYFSGLTNCNCFSFPGVGYAAYNLNISYHVPPNKLKEMEAVVDKEVSRVASLLFEKEMPKEVKILLTHNYLAHIATYDPSYLIKGPSYFNPYSHSAYGALISRVCVCHGFAEAFKRILNRGGVSCEIVTGVIKKSKERHAWNVVKLDDGSCYHVDVTFDDQSKIVFSYFMKDDLYMNNDRTWAEIDCPKCHGNNNYQKIIWKYITSNKTKLVLKGIPFQVLNINF